MKPYLILMRLRIWKKKVLFEKQNLLFIFYYFIFGWDAKTEFDKAIVIYYLETTSRDNIISDNDIHILFGEVSFFHKYIPESDFLGKRKAYSICFGFDNGIFGYIFGFAF